MVSRAYGIGSAALAGSLGERSRLLLTRFLEPHFYRPGGNYQHSIVTGPSRPETAAPRYWVGTVV
jgi:hypothetical protein